MERQDVILKVENVSKQYRLGSISTGTISHDLNRFFARIRGKEDPYLKIGESNDRSTKGATEYVWVLKDINFEVKRGEIVGIIGKNGAGKSTLLKILSKVTGPTTGAIKSKGRIASLLEVGTGFHPEMTGKENIFLNGAILGMTKKEISDKLDEIIAFSGCERYIDTPVKRYSSGMKVRLAFAVAAFLEPDILVIDEVLAVGDAEFQKKSIGKMQDISGTDGRTVLFVSHDMDSIARLCKKTVLLENGLVKEIGETYDVIRSYLTNMNPVSEKSLENHKNRKGKQSILKKIKINSNSGKVFSGEDMSVSLYFDNSFIDLFMIGYEIKDEMNRIVLSSDMEQYNIKFKKEENKDCVNFKIINIPIVPGNYSISVFFGNGFYDIDVVHDAMIFTVFWNNKLIIPPKKNKGSFFAITKWNY
jgi:lipopolysaccharide transport system ATP-binding protein